MKKRMVLLSFCLLTSTILLACSCSLPSLIGIGDYANPTPTLMDCGQTFESNLESQLVSLINEVRLSNNLPPYVVHELLTGAARRHSTDMACNNFMESVGSDGATWHELMVEGGYLVQYGGIATAGGYANDPAGLVQAWLGGEYSVITDPDATEIGVGVATKSGTQYGTYWTVLVALPNR